MAGLKTYKTRRDCDNCFYSTEYEIPCGVAFEPFHRKDNLTSGYTVGDDKVALKCENCELARLL